MIKAEIIADSINGVFNDRITTMVVTMPRYVLAEFNTHRMFSRNSASSRAIPFEKLVKSIKENPFVPIAFQKNHTGMQGTEYFSLQETIPLRNAWNDMRWKAIEEAEKFAETGVTKQLCNRPLEPYMWHTVIVTSTEWENFFYLRCPQYVVHHNGKKEYYRSKKDVLKSLESFPMIHNAVQNRTVIKWLEQNEGQADIHIMAVAEAMWDAMNESMPKRLKPSQWHIPFGDNIDTAENSEALAALMLPELKGDFDANEILDELKIKIATARCARVSYTVVGEESKKPNFKNDVELHDRLLASGHFSPFEHCGRAMSNEEYNSNIKGVMIYDKQDDVEIWDTPVAASRNLLGWSNNFKGFKQYRDILQNQ